jgi:hypothetical protein
VKKLLIVVMATVVGVSAFAQDDAADLAKKLANPVSSLISLPIQVNYDENMGPSEDGSVWKINIQPVLPFSMNDDWNIISRTILPIINQTDVPVKGMGESGIGDIVQSLFFSPKEPTSGGWVLGVGPVFLLPTGSEDALTADKWGVGPTVLALKQVGPWTIGGLVNHIESFAGEDARDDVSATFLQPFASYVTPTKTTLALSLESTYDWKNEEWSVPVNFNVSQMLKVGPQIMQASVGARYWADSPDTAADGWGFRAQLTFLFPR